MPRSRPYEATLHALLADPAEAAAYLNAALAKGGSAEFLLALKDVANVHGGISKLAAAADLNRESMYKMLSEAGNPRISSLNAILHVLGMRLAITPESQPSSPDERATNL